MVSPCPFVIKGKDTVIKVIQLCQVTLPGNWCFPHPSHIGAVVRQRTLTRRESDESELGIAVFGSDVVCQPAEHIKPFPGDAQEAKSQRTGLPVETVPPAIFRHENWQVQGDPVFFPVIPHL